MIDIHCHIEKDDLDNLDNILNKCKDENVEKISDEAAKDYYYISKLLNDSRDDLYSQIFETNELIKGVQENE